MNNSPVEVLTQKDIAPEGLHERIDSVIEKMMTMQQADTPVIHRFSPGLYIREIHIPAGVFSIGHLQRTEHFNVMLKGRVIIINKDGTTTDFIAPQSYTAKPGRKVGYIVDDMVWQNIYATDETDIDKLEEMFLDKNEAVRLNESMRFTASKIEHESDRFDYYEMLRRINVAEDVVRKMSENKDDQIEMPYKVHPYRISQSPIEGKGYFLTVGAKARSILAPSCIDNMRTPAGRYVNHSGKPNAKMRFAENGNLYLVAIKDINGSMGGNVGTEVTTDYGATIALLASRIGDKLCQA